MAALAIAIGFAFQLAKGRKRKEEARLSWAEISNKLLEIHIWNLGSANIYLYSIGQNVVKWPQLATRESGKYNLNFLKITLL